MSRACRRWLSLSAALASVAVASAAEQVANPKTSTATRSDGDAAIRTVVEGYYRAVDNKDLKWIDTHTVPDDDAVFIGTDPEEYWVGWKNARPSHEEMLKAMGKTTITVSQLRVKKLGGGSVAVANYFLDLQGMAGGKPISVKNIRATVVLERRGGKWLLAAGHASVPSTPAPPQ